MDRCAWPSARLCGSQCTSVPADVRHGHRPLYCSCDGDCDRAATTVRMGVQSDNSFYYGMELGSARALGLDGENVPLQ